MGKHIGIVTNQFPVLSETFILNKVIGLQETGLRITVCIGTKRSYNNYFTQNNDFKNIKIININNKLVIIVNLICHPIKAMRLFLQIRRNWDLLNSFNILFKGFLIKIQRFDIIHFEFSGIGVSQLEVLDYYKPARLFVSCRGSAEYVAPLTDPLRKTNLERLFAKIDRIHCVSEAISKAIGQYGASQDKIFINRPAVNVLNDPTNDRRNSFKSCITILSVGRLTFQKGYIYGLMALKDLVTDYPDIEYKIVGMGDDLAEIKFFIEFNNLHKNVILIGALPNEEVKALMLSSDIFLLTSVYEGIANVVLEAMATSMPVVSTRSGGMAEVIIDGFNGLLVDCYDPVGINKAIRKLISDKALREELGSNALRTIIENYTIKRQMNIYLNEYA